MDKIMNESPKMYRAMKNSTCETQIKKPSSMWKKPIQANLCIFIIILNTGVTLLALFISGTPGLTGYVGDPKLSMMILIPLILIQAIIVSFYSEIIVRFLSIIAALLTAGIGVHYLLNYPNEQLSLSTNSYQPLDFLLAFFITLFLGIIPAVNIFLKPKKSSRLS